MVNGAAVEEPYAQSNTNEIQSPVKIPQSHEFLLGDDRERSLGSRIYGARPTGDILGFVRFGWGGD